MAQRFMLGINGQGTRLAGRVKMGIAARMARMLGMFGVVVLGMLLLPAMALAQSGSLAGFGIVMVHGKGGRPTGPTKALADALEAEGAAVMSPRMAWSGTAGQPDSYDIPYEQALAEISQAIAGLRAKGARKIVIAGQSLGANAVIAYAARHPAGLSGVISLAAGHTPERFDRPDIIAAVEKARQMIKAGRGQDVADFADSNQGKNFQVKGTPKAYLSFFDPTGPAVIPRNAAAMPKVPFLWVIGNADRLAQLGPGYAFEAGAKHPKSQYKVVNAGHIDTPTAAKSEVIAWLKSL